MIFSNDDIKLEFLKKFQLKNMVSQIDCCVICKGEPDPSSINKDMTESIPPDMFSSTKHRDYDYVSQLVGNITRISRKLIFL